jgi:SAM-dependent methyltransferase
MQEKVLNFYDSLADCYHLIFEDWDKTVERQAKVLNKLIVADSAAPALKILDCACGIGTQALGLASLGHHIVASDLSPRAVSRCRQEAERRGLNISFQVSDMTSLAEIPDSDFYVVVALDNALPHLLAHQLQQALAAISSKLKPNGLFLASTRDYDSLILKKPTIDGPVFYGKEGNRRIVHQIWDWIDDTRYTLHHYITVQFGKNWTPHHFVSEYRCLLRDELNAGLKSAGFQSVQWVMPAESGYFQPLVLARRQ